jgi:hypothetical protein
LLAVVALLAAAFFAAVYAEPQFEVAPLAEPSASGDAAGGPGALHPTPSGEAAPPPREAFWTIPSWVNPVLTISCAMLAVLIAGFLLWYVVRDTIQARGRPIRVDEGRAGGAAARAEEVAAALESGLAELSDADADPRRAIIACWVRLEETASAAGTPRHPSDAPADYVLRLLAAHQMSRPVLARFAAVYRQARYSSGPVDAGMRSTAVSALRQLRSELTVSAGTTR